MNSGQCPSVVASSDLLGGTVNDPNVVSRGVTDGMVDGFDTALSAALDDAGDEHGTLSSGADSAVCRIISEGETLPTKDQLKSPPRHPSKATGEFKPSRDQKHFLPESQQQVPTSKISQRPTANILASGSWAEVPSDDFFIGSLDTTFACAPNPVTSRGFILAFAHPYFAASAISRPLSYWHSKLK